MKIKKENKTTKQKISRNLTQPKSYDNLQISHIILNARAEFFATNGYSPTSKQLQDITSFTKRQVELVLKKGIPFEMLKNEYEKLIGPIFGMVAKKALLEGNLRAAEILLKYFYEDIINKQDALANAQFTININSDEKVQPNYYLDENDNVLKIKNEEEDNNDATNI